MTTYDTNATAAAIDSPTLTICKYFWSKAKEAYPELANQENNGEPPYNIVPIFPISVAKNTSNFSWDTNNVLITYDDFIKQRAGSMKYFYPIKSMQALIKVTSPTIVGSLNLRTLMYDLLDREDVSAEEINQYSKTLYGVDAKFWLHCINLYQVTYMEDATNLDVQRSVFSTDFVVKYDFHKIVPDSLK